MALLGKGGGGEVWAVRDRITGDDLALKVLAEDAGENEVMALVREAVTLSGLEGLGVPRVVAFGRLPGSTRRFLVRERVDGKSLEEILDEPRASRAASDPWKAWLLPLASAADQLTALHRAGLLHGDIKPANVIVGPDGTGTLVDLGLATPWREGGSRPRGLTPKYAAPELFHGAALTVRAEVFAFGATLGDAIERRRADLSDALHASLASIATRATEREPDARFPSIDELASMLKRVAKIETRALTSAWPVVGADAGAEALAAEVSRLAPGQGLAIVGPRRSGRSTLANRLAWSLGVSGSPVARVEPATGNGGIELVELELVAVEGTGPGFVVVVDDLEALGADVRARIRRSAADHGARIVAVGSEDAVAEITARGVTTFVVPPLDGTSAAELVKRAIPSLPDRLVRHLLDRSGRRPGALRSFVMQLEGRPVTSTEEIDEIIDVGSTRTAPASRSRAESLAELGRALETGRFEIASACLDALGESKDDGERVELALARARIALARGDAAAASEALDAVAELARSGQGARDWSVVRGRTLVRAGNASEAVRLTEPAARGAERDATTADALAVHGLALALTGDESTAIPELEEAVRLAREVHNARIEAVAWASLGVVQQRAGRSKEARAAYESALGAAEKARDAWTIGTTRLNLAGLAKVDGDLGRALAHFEAALDMGQRAGALVIVQQALFNLANLDLYLGRSARAAASIEKLAEHRSGLAPSSNAQLLGLEAELASLLGEADRAAHLYDASATAYDSVGRPLDAVEARLEAMLSRLEGGSVAAASAAELARAFDELERALPEGGFQRHEPLAAIVRGAIAIARGDDTSAREAFDSALEKATRDGQREAASRALEKRARLSTSQGARALARRDLERAVEMFEETAAKLPRDLREVFWNDPRRRALRVANEGAMTRLSPSDPSIAPSNVTVTEMGSQRQSRLGAITSMGTPMPGEDRLQRIFEITRDLAREHDLDRLLERITDHAVGLLRAERGLIVVVDERGNVVAHTSRDSKGEETHQTFSRSVADRVIREGEPVIATSARDDERLAEAVSVHQLMIQSIACVPIRGAPPAGATIGALYLETRLRPGVRFREELPTLAAFADQAAIAIESARLLSELRRRGTELERANGELEEARAKLAERLGARTEQLASARRDLKQARQELRGHFGYGGLVGTSAAMRRVYALIDRLKDLDIPVLVTGESGTGKEVIAKAIHTAGPRSRGAFLGVNCGAIPANLLESELFGNVRGAFTGADRDRKGLFREADQGTLLLDEVGELPMAMQTGLLRVLQEKTVRPVGAVREEPCDARIVAATNRDLSQMVAAGTFREDLFYRLHVVEVKVPALRERAEDIPALVDHFLTLFASRHKRDRKSVERRAMRHLQSFDWPGNVRQLEHVLLNAWLLADDDEITIDDLDLPMSTSRSIRPEPPQAELPPAPRPVTQRPPGTRTRDEHRDVEKERILSALASCNWNRVQAAKVAGIPRRTFYRRLKEYGIA